MRKIDKEAKTERKSERKKNDHTCMRISWFLCNRNVGSFCLISQIS